MRALFHFHLAFSCWFSSTEIGSRQRSGSSPGGQTNQTGRDSNGDGAQRRGSARDRVLLEEIVALLGEN